MFLNLDNDGPIYAQLVRALKSAILDGTLPSGYRLPPTRRLASEFRISRMTAVSAYEQLRAEGYLRSRVGSGCYVNPLQIEPALAPPDPAPIAPPSRYARRARATATRISHIALRHRGLPLELEYGVRITDPTLQAAWGRELSSAAQRVHAKSALYTQGARDLREQVCGYLAARRGVRVDPDDVLIVNGAQQAFDITARVLLDGGDAVAVEEPHYFGLTEALSAHGAHLLYIPTDEEGLVCAKLPRRAPKLICVTPSHEFPAGPVMSLPRRLELLRYARDKHCWILEDDYDSEFRYDSRPLAALRELDQGSRVIYVGTFSKLMFSALRLGYVVPPSALKQDFIDARCLCDFGSALIQQSALASFMRNGGFDRHLRRIDKALRIRRQVLLDGLHRYAGDRVRVADYHTGTHVVVWLDDYSSEQLDGLIKRASARGLGLYPMAPHYHTAPSVPGLLLGYAGSPVAALREAMRIFGECLNSPFAKAPNRDSDARGAPRARGNGRPPGP